MFDWKRCHVRLGASPWQAFRRVTFPLARRSIVAGSLMMWARGISEFGAVVILTYYPMVTPTLIYQRFESYGLTQAIPVAAILIIVCAVIFIGVRTLLRRGKSMISLRRVNVEFRHFALRDINLEVEAGDYFMLVGPSGAGKTLLLETIAGLHQAKEAVKYGLAMKM